MSLADDHIAQNLPAATARWGWWCGAFGTDMQDFLLAWIAIESGGNPCDKTAAGEAGIFQLEPGSNQADAGVTPADLDAGCTDGTAFGLGNAYLQVTSGIRYVNACRSTVAQYAPWASSSSVDYWKMVKMVHVAPARVKTYGPTSSSWDDFAQQCLDGGDTPQNWIDNAAAVGAYGRSPWLVAAELAAAAIALVIAGYVVRRRVR